MATAAMAQLHTYPLDSTNPEVHWQVSPERTMTDAVPAVVPGTVFTAYVEAGREPCPEYGSNIYEVDETKYSRPFWYRGEFRLPRALQPGQHVWLCFDNTNRYADFWFNGQKISGTATSEKDVSGHMLRSRFDVTALYQEDHTNIIEVKIYDTDQKKTRRAEGPYGVACSPSYLAAAGWDWMPYVPGRLAGITGHARVEVTGGVSLIDPWVRSYLPTNDRAELTFTTDVANHTSGRQQVTIEGTIQPGNIHFAKQVWVAGGDTAHVHVDSREVESLVVSHPRLWWPGGYGEPSLYDCQVVCRVDGQVSDSRTVRFGIPSIALWCGANETHPASHIDQALRMIVMEEDVNDRLYKSCSNQDGLSGSGWWKDMPPRHHFETSASNLAFNKPAYPYGRTYGYGMRSEIGMATFPQYESVRLFIPADKLWPLPTDEQLKEEDNNVWNHHFFGKEALNAGPVDYRRSIEERYGMSQSLEEFCEKAQLINLEDMRGMYEAWQDKMWHDASGLLIWMSHPAYPSFVWQTYDYYYDPTGCYWGARKACEPQHIQWNCLTGSVKVINTTSKPLNRVHARAIVFDLSGQQVAEREAVVSVESSNIKEAFVLNALPAAMLFIRLQLTAPDGQLLLENMYWTNTQKDLDYTPLNQLAEARLTVEQEGRNALRLKNLTERVAFANRLRLVDAKTGERILPVIWSENYVTLMPGEERVITFETEGVERPVTLLVKPYGQKERQLLKLNGA